jgi:hypothetical protein
MCAFLVLGHGRPKPTLDGPNFLRCENLPAVGALTCHLTKEYVAINSGYRS